VPWELTFDPFICTIACIGMNPTAEYQSVTRSTTVCCGYCSKIKSNRDSFAKVLPAPPSDGLKKKHGLLPHLLRAATTGI
jgi:hypothetical protein